MSPPPTYNPIYPSPARYSGNQDTAAMLDCICQPQLTVQQHVLTNMSKFHEKAVVDTELISLVPVSSCYAWYSVSVVGPSIQGKLVYWS